METLGSYFCNGSLHGNMVRTINLRKEICFNMDDNDAILFPIYIRAYRSEIFRFSQIIEREVNSVVYMTEFVDVIEA